MLGAHSGSSASQGVMQTGLSMMRELEGQEGEWREKEAKIESEEGLASHGEARFTSHGL